jgi:hypothetical protein
MGELFEIYGEFDFGHKPCDITLRSNNRASIMSPPVGKRSPNIFRHKDVVRAMKSAKAGGLKNIGAVEVITKDGTTIRVLGERTAEQNEWDTVRAEERSA